MNIKFCIDVTIHIFPYGSHYSHRFCKSTAIIRKHTWSALLKTCLNFVITTTFVQWFHSMVSMVVSVSTSLVSLKFFDLGLGEDNNFCFRADFSRSTCWWLVLCCYACVMLSVSLSIAQQWFSMYEYSVQCILA